MHYPHGPHRSSYFTVWRDGDWKVIHHARPEQDGPKNQVKFGGGNYQLFHLARDPFEQRDLAAVKSDRLKTMVAGMAAALKAHEADYPIDQAGREIKPRLPGSGK
jgi:arylsulfatase A-like enzyme